MFYKEQYKFECDCMMFESCGRPCSHIICAMRYDHVTKFPPSLICKRWLKDAKSSLLEHYDQGSNDNEMIVMAGYGVLVSSLNSVSSWSEND